MLSKHIYRKIIFHKLVLLLEEILKDLYQEEGEWSKILNEKRVTGIKAINMGKYDQTLTV